MFVSCDKRNARYNRGKWKRPLVYAAADAVYRAVEEHQPKERIDWLLKRLKTVISSRKSW